MKWMYLLIPLFLAIGKIDGTAQNATYISYINRYKDLAIEQMHQYGIPASITLAQGLLESAGGQSELSRKANNHFGIKCGGTWNGPYVLKDDDERNEKFRAYASPRESYIDHSLFLTTRSRYAFLFQYDITDYKSWAHGLKKAGYATNPRYAHTLIGLIHRYDLHQYDRRPSASSYKRTGATTIITEQGALSTLVVRKNNKNYYVIARAGDTFESIGAEMGVSARKLRRYNEVDKRYNLSAGDIVYLEKKQSKADRSFKHKYHQVQVGESLYAIAQKYGMRIGTLYKNNELPKDYVVKTGDRLRIR